MANNLQVKVEKSAGCRRILTVEVSAERVNEKYEEVKKSVTESASVPGFRKGKVPESIINAKYSDLIKKETIERILPDVYPEAVKESDEKPVTEPVISKLDYNKGENLSFVAEFDVFPEFSLPKCEGVDINKKVFKVKDKDVDDAVKQIMERQAGFDDVKDRGAAVGDTAVVDYNVTVGSKVIDKRSNIWMPLEEKTLFPLKFANIKGIKPGEEKEFEDKVPEDYFQKGFTGEVASVKFKLIGLKTKNIPELTDDLVKKMGNYKNIDEFKKGLRQYITSDRNRAQEEDVKTQVFEYFLKKTSFALPQFVLERNKSRAFENMVEHLKKQGMKDTDIEKEKPSIEKASAEEAEKNLKIAYMMSRIITENKLEASDDEVRNKIDDIAKHSGQKTEDVKKYLGTKDKFENLRYSIEQDKVMEFILNKAKIKEIKE